MFPPKSETDCVVVLVKPIQVFRVEMMPAGTVGGVHHRFRSGWDTLGWVDLRAGQ